MTTGTAAPTTVSWILPFTGLLLFGVWRRRNVFAGSRLAFGLTMAILSGALLLSMTGCGSGGVNTPKGSSTVTVTLTGTPNGTTTEPSSGAGSIVKTFTFTLNVQQANGAIQDQFGSRHSLVWQSERLMST